MQPVLSTGLSVPVRNSKVYMTAIQRKILTFSDTQKGTKEGEIQVIPLDDSRSDEVMDPEQKAQLLDEIELLDGASAEFDQELVSKGRAYSGIFWICSDQLWCGNISGAFPADDHFSACQECADEGLIDPMDDDFSAFVFKIQANMNKAHRDRIAFMRICSGKFDAGHGSISCAGRQENASSSASADDGRIPS